jgi:ribosomal protein S19E (S16A)
MPFNTILSADVDALRAIKNSERVDPRHLIRLELMGLVWDKAGGVLLTEAGRHALKSVPVKPVVEEVAAGHTRFDVLGRRRNRQIFL